MKKIFFFLFLGVLSATVSAQAQTVRTRYVDTDCANNGDGTAASPCAGSPGAAGPHNTLAAALTCEISEVQAELQAFASVERAVLNAIIRRALALIQKLIEEMERYEKIKSNDGNQNQR